jgi:hypothetical protein
MATKKTGGDKAAKVDPTEMLKPVPVKSHGRPSDYRPEVCFDVINLGAEGKSKTVIAAKLGISIRTLYNWMEQYPGFLQAMEQAQTLAQCWWEEAGQKGMFMQGFNASIWSRSMAARFPKDWRENKNVELAGKDGGAIEMNVTTTINVDQMSARALDALEEALEIIAAGTEIDEAGEDGEDEPEGQPN